MPGGGTKDEGRGEEGDGDGGNINGATAATQEEERGERATFGGGYKPFRVGGFGAARSAVVIKVISS
jgi:hypothetical protein